MLLSNGSPGEGSAVDFERDVLHASREQPIVVDFWAPWCGPCQILGPVLEKLEREANGAWVLVKINTDEHPALSQRAGIRGIPAVKLYVDGAIAGEFTGALPEAIVRRWLDEHLPAEWKHLLEEGRRLLRAGDRRGATAQLERVVQLQPEDEEARALLARAFAFEDLEEAAAVLVGLEYRAEAEAVRDLQRFLSLARKPERLADGPMKARYLSAAHDLEQGDFDAALGKLLAVLQKDRYYDEDGPRRAIVALFLLLGEHDPAVRKYRPTFNRSLY